MDSRNFFVGLQGAENRWIPEKRSVEASISFSELGFQSSDWRCLMLHPVMDDCTRLKKQLIPTHIN